MQGREPIKLFVILFIGTLSYFAYLTYFRINENFIAISLEARGLDPYFDVKSVFLFSMLSFSHYLVHGVVEWFRLFEHIGLSSYYMGAYEFYPLVKFWSLLGVSVPSFMELASVAHKTGVYTTFWGPFIMGFGALSFFMSFIFEHCSL